MFLPREKALLNWRKALFVSYSMLEDYFGFHFSSGVSFNISAKIPQTILSKCYSWKSDFRPKQNLYLFTKPHFAWRILKSSQSE